jgi:hypothetical protein
VTPGTASKEVELRRTVIALLGLLLPALAHAQKVPDPDKVDPQYRDAAEKRKSELMKTKFCTERAEKEKVLRRDLATYVNRCVESVGKAETAENPKARQ